MERIDPKQITEKTARQLQAASYPGSRLALVHTAIALGCSLVLTLLSYFLNHQVAGTGGLAGIGTRSVLQSVQSILALALTAAMPFWEFGFVAAAIGYARQEQVSPKHLLKGFGKLFPLLRLLLLQAALYSLLLTLAMQLASTVVLLTPLGGGMLEMVESLSQNAEFVQTGMLPEEMLMPLVKAALPAYVVGLLVFVLAAIPVSYRLRLTPYMVLDGSKRVLFAMVAGNRIMKGNCLDFFKLDLHFWWYWVLQGVCSLLAFGDVLLPLIGVQLPISADAAMFLFYGLQLVLSLVLSWRWRATVETAYAVAYDTLTQAYRVEK